MKRTVTQNRQLYALYKELSITDTIIRSQLVRQFTNNRTESSAEMEVTECQNLINTLRYKAHNNSTHATATKRQYNSIEQQARRGIFKLMYECGFINNEDTAQRKVIVINGWVKKKMRLDKSFNALSLAELQKMTNQLQAVKRNYKETEIKKANLN